MVVQERYLTQLPIERVQVNTQAPHTISFAIAHTTTNAYVEQITVLTIRNQKKSQSGAG